LQENFKKFVQYVKEKDPDFAKLAINPPQIHVTLFVMHLGDKEKIEEARQCLLQNKELLDEFFPEGGPLLHFFGIDTFENGRVVFTTPKQTHDLTEFCKLAHALFDRFGAAELLPDQTKEDFEAEFKPHATLMKVSGKRLFISRKKLLKKMRTIESEDQNVSVVDEAEEVDEEDEEEIVFGPGFNLLFNDVQEETGQASRNVTEDQNDKNEEEAKESTTNIEELTDDYKTSNTSLLAEKNEVSVEESSANSNGETVVMMDENQDMVNTAREPTEDNYEEFARLAHDDFSSSTSGLRRDMRISKRELKKRKKAEKLERLLETTATAKSTNKGKNKKRKRNFDFGAQIIKSVDLCSMLQPKAEDGYYAVVESIEFRERTA
ncbi:5575_t:CDS:2, partial [Ambispora leptoticha]